MPLGGSNFHFDDTEQKRTSGAKAHFNYIALNAALKGRSSTVAHTLRLRTHYGCARIAVVHALLSFASERRPRDVSRNSSTSIQKIALLRFRTTPRRWLASYAG